MISALTKKDSTTTDHKLIKWVSNFIYACENITISTCKTFLCSVLGVDKSRFSNIQTKMLNNASLGDKKGTNDNKPIKLSKELQELIWTHFCYEYEVYGDKSEPKELIEH